jgi:hypothetical protein
MAEPQKRYKVRNVIVSMWYGGKDGSRWVPTEDQASLFTAEKVEWYRQKHGDVTVVEYTQCPAPDCEDGSYDTGGSTPEGSWIRAECSTCKGAGYIPA